MYNVGIILGVIYFAKWWGLPGLAWGVVLGAFLHFAVQLPVAVKLGFNYKLVMDVKDPGTRRIIKMAIPRTLTLFTAQINLVIVTVIASTLTAGSLTVFNLANDLQSFPLGIFAISFAVASFPTLSSLSSEESRNEFARNLVSITKQILFFMIPISVLLIVLRAQVVRVILGTGKFGWEDTILTLNALQIFALSLFAQALIPLFSRAFWALHDSRTPFLTSLVGTVINLFLAIILSEQFGIIGLVGAFSVASTINVLLLYYLMSRKTEFVDHSRIYEPLAKIILASFVAGAFSYLTLYVVEPFLNTRTFIGIFAQGLFAGAVGIIMYCLVGWKLKIEELMIFRNLIEKKLFKTKVETTEIISED
jgi:putative peptidoglycan lipid II flippase